MKYTLGELQKMIDDYGVIMMNYFKRDAKKKENAEGLPYATGLPDCTDLTHMTGLPNIKYVTGLPNLQKMIDDNGNLYLCYCKI